MILQPVVIGLVLGALEGAILAASRQKLGIWVYIQSILFWFTCGVMIGMLDSPLSPILTGALIAVFLNLPWYINISIIPRQVKHLAPLIVSSILLGALGGLLKSLLPG